jgi:hypothetical protein
MAFDMNTLADASSGAGAAIAGLIVLMPVLLFIYSVVCLLVPIFIYRIMRRGTDSYETLMRIERLLATQQQPRTQSSMVNSVDDWDRKAIYGAAPVQIPDKRILNLGVKDP